MNDCVDLDCSIGLELVEICRIESKINFGNRYFDSILVRVVGIGIAVLVLECWNKSLNNFYIT
jgi:hypothetical protein